MTDIAVHAAAGSGAFLGIDWGSVGLVFVVAFVATVAVVTLFSLGLRLLAVGSVDEIDDSDEPGTSVSAGGTRPAVATGAAWVCITIGALGVVYGIYLVIPQFH